MSATTDHIQTAIDQLKLADDLVDWLTKRAVTTDQVALHNGFLAGAVVHALIAVAESVREAGAGVAGWSETDAPKDWED